MFDRVHIIMRTPRGRPDLRLAESYVPAALTFSKGLCYTLALCLLSKWMHKWGWIPPLLVLFYDHVFWPLSFHAFAFLDSTSICVDVVAGTIVSLLREQEATHPLNWIGLLLWSLVGACHTLLWPQKHEIPYVLCMLLNLVVPAAGIACVLYATNLSTNNATQGLSPFLLRSTLYLVLVMIDAYTLRAPTQRERDKVGVLRYGAILLAPTVAMLSICSGICTLAQMARLYSSSPSSWMVGANEVVEHPPTTSTIPSKFSLLQPNCLKSMEVAAPLPSSCSISIMQQSNSVDKLDFHEAFRLAKLQYKDGKNSC